MRTELKRWAKWIATVESTPAHVEAGVAGQLLLRPEGLSALLQGLPAPEYQAQLFDRQHEGDCQRATLRTRSAPVIRGARPL